MATSVNATRGTGLVFGLNPSSQETLLVSIAQGTQEEAASTNVASAIWTPQMELVNSNQVISSPPSAVTLNDTTYCFYETGGELWCVSGTAGSASPDFQVPANISGTGIPGGVIFYGDIYLFYQGNNGQLWYSIFNGTSWSLGTVIGVSMSGTPSAAVFTPPGATAPNLYVFYPGSGASSGSLYYSVFNGSTWTNNASSIASITGTPSAAVFNCGLYVFYQGSGANLGNLWYNVFNGSTWAGGKQVPNVAMSCSPSAVVFNYQLYAVYQGSGSNSGQIWYNAFNGSTWAGATQAAGAVITGSPSAFVYNNELCYACSWPGGTEITYSELFNTSTGGIAPTAGSATGGSASGPAVVVNNNVPYLFYLGSGQIWYNVYNGLNDWGPCTLLPNVEASTSPGAVMFNDQAYVFYSDAGDLWCSVLTFTENDWSWSSSIVPNITMSQSASAAVYNGVLYMFYQSASGGELCYSTTSNGTSWSAGIQVPGTTLAKSPSAVVFNNDLYVFHIASSGSGLNYNRFNGSTWVGDTAVPGAGMYGSPAAVVFNNQAGASQIEVIYRSSESNSELCSAVFNGSAWSEVQALVPNVVVADAPAAVVFDNMLYVLYTGVGSSTDELLYTMLTGDGWSQPATMASISMGGSASAIVTTPPGYSVPQLFIFHTDATPDGSLWYCQCNGSIWNNSQITTASALSSGPSAAVLGDEIYVFYQGASNALCYSLMTASNQWLSSTVTGITISQSPAAVTFMPPGSTSAQIYLFYQDASADGLLWYATYDVNALSAPMQLVPTGGSITAAVLSQSPAAAVFTPSGAPSAQLYVFYQGPAENGQLWCSNSLDGISWTASQMADASMSNSPSALAANNALTVVYEGSGNNSGDVFYTSTTDGSTWNPATETGPMVLSNSPSLLTSGNLLYCITQGFGATSTTGTGNTGNGELWYSMFNGNNWSWNAMINNVSIAGTPSAVACAPSSTSSSQPYIFYQSGTNAGQLWYVTFNGSSWSAPQQVIPQGFSATSQVLSQSPCVVFDDSVPTIFYQGPGNNGTLWWTWPATISPAITGFSSTQLLPSGSMSQSPGVTIFSGQPCFFYQGPENNGQLWWGTAAQPKDLWTASQVPGITGYSPNTSPSPVVYNNDLYVFYSIGGTSSSDSGSLAYSVYNGTSWSASIQPKLSNPANNATCNMYQSPAAAVFNNQIFVFFQDPEATGALWYTVFNGSSWSQIMQAGSAIQMSKPTGTLQLGMAAPESPFMNFAISPFQITV